MTLTKIFDFRILDCKIGIFISFPSPEKGEAEYLQLGFRILLVLSVVCISNEKLTKQLCKVGLQAGWEKEMLSFSFHYNFTSITTLSG